MSNPNTKRIEEILSSFKLTSYVESIHEHDGKTHITIGCNKQRLAEFQELVRAASIELGDMARITLTNAKVEDKGVRGVDKVIMVASGKGGVGKSTIAFNLAISLAASGKKVGLVDVDIYGPSLPSLASLTRKPALDGSFMIPHKKYGIKLMSVGFLVDSADALIWRGPMTTKMLYQLIRLTNWNFDGELLDYLIIDTPPGTGDVHLSLAENYKIDSAIVISTPQDLAIADVRRALTMFKKLNIKVAGIIENYSYIELDGRKQHIFGASGANNKLAKKFGTKVLAEIPITPELGGSKPVVYYKPDGAMGRLFRGVCEGL